MDASHYDWQRKALDLVAIRADGMSLFTHKATEQSSYLDPYFARAMAAARAASFPIVGAYHVLHPASAYSISAQVNHFTNVVRTQAPWYRDHPCYIVQIDAEKFDYMPAAPGLGDIHAFGDAVRSALGLPAARIIAYAPKWLYGDSLTGIRYPLWASNYGANPAVPYRQAYPGDTSSRWVAYSGRSPLLLQFGSRLSVAAQQTCDINAYRGTLAQLLTTLGAIDMEQTDALVYPTGVAGRTVGNVLSDAQNMRDFLYGQSVNPNPPAAGSPLDKLIKLANAGPTPFQAAEVAAALAANTTFLTALARAVADELRNRLAT